MVPATLESGNICFNPRTRTGCDLHLLALHPMPWRFNPRTRTGCDPEGYTAQQVYDGFNPRTRTGCDG